MPSLGLSQDFLHRIVLASPQQGWQIPKRASQATCKLKTPTNFEGELLDI